MGKSRKWRVLKDSGDLQVTCKGAEVVAQRPENRRFDAVLNLDVVPEARKLPVFYPQGAQANRQRISPSRQKTQLVRMRLR